MKSEHHAYSVLMIGNEQPLHLLAESLRDDYTVFLAGHLQEGVDYLTDTKAALVIIEQDVLTTMQETTQAFETPGKPFWLVLTESPQQTIPPAIQAHVYQCLPAAWPLRELQLIVQRALEHYQLHTRWASISQEAPLFEKDVQEALPIGRKGTEMLPEADTLVEKKRQEVQRILGQLVQSEKMTTLGQMVAGIAHEINTPSGAINAAITNLTHHLKLLVGNIEDFARQQMTWEYALQMTAIAEQMLVTLETSQRRSPGEIRLDQKRISEQLRRQDLPNIRKLAKNIARMGLGDDIAQLLTLAEQYDLETLVAFFTHWNRVLSSAKDIKLSIGILTHVISALKSYAYPHQEKPALADLHDSIETALTILNNKLKHRIHIDLQFGKIPQIYCYSSELSHVWINLIHNAIQAIDGQGNIAIETFAAEHYVGVRITDNGAGIPTNIQRRIFELNFTTKAQGEGTGLGLYIAKQIIERHGGTIHVASVPGKTTFEVLLPFSPPVFASSRGSIMRGQTS